VCYRFPLTRSMLQAGPRLPDQHTWMQWHNMCTAVDISNNVGHLITGAAHPRQRRSLNHRGCSSSSITADIPRGQLTLWWYLVTLTITQSGHPALLVTLEITLVAESGLSLEWLRLIKVAWMVHCVASRWYIPSMLACHNAERRIGQVSGMHQRRATYLPTDIYGTVGNTGNQASYGTLGNTMVITDRKRAARSQALTTKLSHRILSLCEERGLSQRQLAIQAGLDPSYISRIIRGQTEPGLVTLEAIAYTLGMTVSEFLEGVTR
jgi:ribosome-binding protein aMBF1 (putative translation factor)